MSDEEMVEHWLICRDCGEESPRKMIPKSLVDKMEEMGHPMSPSLGRCETCRIAEAFEGVEAEGNA